jgi:hypothetical protein
MTGRAVFGLNMRNPNLLVALALGAAVVLLGCGGGGGGGNNNGGGGAGACGSAAGSNATVVCGYVLSNGTTSGVNGATVRVTNFAGGTTFFSGATAHNSASNQDGFYKFTAPNGAAIITVLAPTGFLANYLLFNGHTYDLTQQATVAGGGGVCAPALPSPLPLSPGDNLLSAIYLFNDQSAPPPPVFVCPR